MAEGISYDLAQKIYLYLAAVETGRAEPDPIGLLEAKERLLRLGEPQLARECERVARRCLPNFRKDLS